MNRIIALRVLCIGCLSLFACQTRAQAPSRQQVIDAMRIATKYFHRNVSSHGGYVYYYAPDLSVRYGEGIATADQIWVQPPGTPSVGKAMHAAYRATGESIHLLAAKDAAYALVAGQLKSGGWTNAIDFDLDGERTADYRNRPGRGRNYSSLDDGQTQSALGFLVEMDQTLGHSDSMIHHACAIGLDSLLSAQFDHGGFPQVWAKPPSRQPVAKARYPDDNFSVERRIKNYWDLPTINDNVPGHVVDTLILASTVYEDPRYLDSLMRLGDFLIAAQMPTPQRGWAQQYNWQMEPAWARPFEPPAVSGQETQDVIEALLKIYAFTQEVKYLSPIEPAIEWLRSSRLADGRLARYYELQTNRPVYMRRRGERYEFSYDDSRLPSHYSWKVTSRIEDLAKRYRDCRRGEPVVPPRITERDVQEILSSQDSHGRWLVVHDGSRLVGQPRFATGQRYLSSRVFAENMTLLSKWLNDQDESTASLID